MPIEPDDILLNKSVIIERCIKRIKNEFEFCPELDNYTHVDAMTLNIERACQAAIDMAMHLVALRHLGIPQSSADAFLLMKKNGLLNEKLYTSLKAMTGFRNVAIHEYQELDTSILRYIAEKGYKDLVSFCKCLNIRIVH
jgi:uncharacterized protein YutE (UPF0331/DUF86 family)